MSKSFADTLQEDRRLVVLRILAAAPGFRANESILQAALDQWGHAVSRDQVRTDLMWLSEQRLLDTEEIGGVLIVSLSGRGEDVQSGRATVPGIKRPRAGS
jgi:hypothetical protein